MNVLIELIKEQGRVSHAPCSTRRLGKWYQVTIGIGDDDVAYLTLDDDAFGVLVGADPTLRDLVEDGTENGE